MFTIRRPNVQSVSALLFLLALGAVAERGFSAPVAAAPAPAATGSDSVTASQNDAEARLRAVSRLAARSAQDDSGNSGGATLIEAIRAVTDSAAAARERLEAGLTTASDAERAALIRRLAQLERGLQRRILEIQRDHARRAGHDELARRANLALARLESAAEGDASIGDDRR